MTTTENEERAAPHEQDGPGRNLYNDHDHDRGLGDRVRFDGIERELPSTTLPLIPLRPGMKLPAVGQWQRLGTNDGIMLRAWACQFPGLNWGIVTGNGVGVIDIDVKNDPDGVGGLQTFVDVIEGDMKLDLSHLPLVHTPSGGAHLYFRYEGILPSKVPWLPDIDIKADGSNGRPGHQVVAPGSVLELGGEERSYKLVRGSLDDIPLAPAGLLNAIRTWQVARRGGGGGGRRSSGGSLPTTEDAMLHGLPPGDRNNLMHDLACRWWGAHGLRAEVTVWGIARKVWEATPRRDTFPWEEAQVAVRSAYRHIAREHDKNLAAIAAITKNWGRP